MSSAKESSVQEEQDVDTADPKLLFGAGTDRLTKRGIAGFCAAAGGAGFYYAFSNAALPLLIPSSNVLLLNLMSNTRSIEGTIVQPIIGAWSDKT
jgi:hypothetical protein